MAWLNENRITTTSYPFISAYLGLLNSDFKGYILTSDFKDYEGDDTEKDGSIVGAEIEHATSYDRMGTISLVDPSGRWAKYITEVGMQSNSWLGGMGPNIVVTYGWRGLKRDNNEEDEVSGQVIGYIDTVEQDISPEGIYSATIHFIPFSQAQLGLIKFLSKEDMYKGSPIQLWESVGSDLAPQDYLNYVIEDRGDDSNFSVANVLREKNIHILFLDLDGFTDPIPQGHYPRIRFGDHLESYINDVISLMKPTEETRKNAKENDVVWSYEKYEYEGPSVDNISEEDPRRKKVKQAIKEKMSGMSDEEIEAASFIVYFWVKTPTSNSEKTVGEERENPLGPALTWKFDGSKNDGRDKQILNWQSDLSSHSAIIHQFQDELSKRLAGFSESDWDNLLDHIDSEGSISKAERTRNRVADAVTTGGDLPDRLIDDATRFSMFKAMTDLEEAERKYETGQATSALRAAIMNNAFKVTASIMGDPSMGTIYQAGEFDCVAHFDDGGGTEENLAKIIFENRYMLLKFKHKFEEGKYTTDITMITQIPPFPKDNTDDTDSRSSGRVS